MDVTTFDRLVAEAVRRPTRRAAVRVLAGGLLGGLLAQCGRTSTFAAQPTDSDGDGLYDVDETNVYGTNPSAYDSDGDGSSDGEEVYYGTDPLGAGGSTGTAGLDSDGDGLYDTDETSVYGTNAYAVDTDGDGVGDGEEVYNGTNPLASGVTTVDPICESCCSGQPFQWTCGPDDPGYPDCPYPCWACPCFN